jgi:endonuclease/exonuclease/phosphatase family metal-dependent hydrolase
MTTLRLHKPLCLTVAAWLSVTTGAFGADPAGSIARPDAPHARVLTWNISANSVFPATGEGRRDKVDAERPERFARIIRALRPDVLCLQEIFPPRTPEDVGPLLDAIAPLGGERRWQSHGIRDVAIATPHALSMRAARQEDWGNGVPRSHAMALVKFPAELEVADLYVVCAHMQSRGQPQEIAARQRHADAIVQWLRELRAPAASGGLAANTPIVILGDFNAYRTDPARHIETLLTGAIADTTRFGRPFPPDWDGTGLADAAPRHNGVGPAVHTFGDGIGPPPPAAVDRILYSDSRLTLAGSFVLNTMTLDAATLARAGLQATDVMADAAAGRFDHLPVVADFRARRP